MSHNLRLQTVRHWLIQLVTLQLHTSTWRDCGQPSRSAWYSQSVMHAYLIRCRCGGTDESTCGWMYGDGPLQCSCCSCSL